MVVKITNYGGVVQSIWVPDKRGHLKDVVLGFPKLSDYVSDFTQGATQTPWPAPGGSGDTYFGAIIGRYANRIANASFTLNGKTYKLDANNGPNTLHGGYYGWNTVVWTASGHGIRWRLADPDSHLPGRRGVPPHAEPGVHRIPGRHQGDGDLHPHQG
jgi:aldose 1-epimerase